MSLIRKQSLAQLMRIQDMMKDTNFDEIIKKYPTHIDNNQDNDIEYEISFDTSNEIIGTYGCGNFGEFYGDIINNGVYANVIGAHNPLKLKYIPNYEDFGVMFGFGDYWHKRPDPKKVQKFDYPDEDLFDKISESVTYKEPFKIKKFNEFLNEKINNLNNNFYKWFKNSKVVNKDGSPKIVYHGVGEIDYEYNELPFEEFEGNRGIGWFAENKSYAENYSNMGIIGAIMELYLSIQNPYILKLVPEEKITLTEFNEKTGYNVIKKYLDTSEFEEDDEYREVWDWYDPTYTNFTELLEKDGYDGMRTIEQGKYVCWLPFYQDQIKSATYNNGNYDSNNTNITK